MNTYARCWAKTPVTSQRTKVTRHARAPLQPFLPPNRRFDHVYLDIVGPLPPSREFRYLLTCVDRYTRWPETISLADITAETVARAFVDVWVAPFGRPSTVTTDRNRQFQSSLITALTRLLGARYICTTAYHPSANGMVERLPCQLKAALSARRERERRIEHLSVVLFGLR